MRACIELPRDYGWGPARILRGRMEDDGYHVTEIRFPSHILLAVTGSRPGRERDPRESRRASRSGPPMTCCQCYRRWRRCCPVAAW